MSVRRKTEKRMNLIRPCHMCGKIFPTTAASPFMRIMYNVDGKLQKTCYFCSSSCKEKSYKHRFDGKAEQRRAEKEKSRDISAKNKKYYQAHKEQERQRAKKRYWENHEESKASSRYSKKKKKLLEAEHER